MSTITEPFYAVSPHRTGVFWFPTMDEANLWVARNDGQRLGAEQVSPDTRMVCTALHIHQLHRQDHGCTEDDLSAWLWEDLTELAQQRYLRQAREILR